MKNRTRCSRLGRLLAAAIVSTPACGASSPLQPMPQTLQSPTPFPQNCRTYATQWVATSDFGQPVTNSASFSATDATLTQTSPAGTSQVVRRTVYQSVADFIDEPTVVGRVLFLRTESCANDTCTGGLADVQTPTYDSQRRRTGQTLSLNGVPLLVEAYSAWDSRGRPTAGTRTQSGCVAPLSLTYDDVARTAAVAPSGIGSGTLCLGAYFSSVQSYDADGNPITDTGSAGGTSTTTTSAITATARLCK